MREGNNVPSSNVYYSITPHPALLLGLLSLSIFPGSFSPCMVHGGVSFQRQIAMPLIICMPFFYPCWATAPSFWSLCGRSQFCDTFCFLPSPQYALEQLSSCIVVYMSAFGIAVFSLWHWLSPCIHTHAVWEPEAPVFVVLKWNNVSDSHPIPSFCVIAHLHYFCCFDVSSRHWHTFHGRGWAIG